MIVACVLIALPIGWLLSPSSGSAVSVVDTTFEATTYLRPIATSSIRTDGMSLPQVARIATLGEVPRRTAEELNHDGTWTDLMESIVVTADDATQLLSIEATDSAAAYAERMANTFAEELTKYLKQTQQQRRQELVANVEDIDERIAGLERQIEDAPENSNKGGGTGSAAAARLGELQIERDVLIQQLAQLPSDASSELEVVEEAVAEPIPSTGTVPSLDSRRSRMAIAALLGLAVGAGIALASERLNTRIHDREQAEEVFGLPVLAEIPAIPRRHRETVLPLSSPGTPASNAFQLLAAALEFGRYTTDSSHAPAGGRAILVTSPGVSEGKSTTVANLAAAFAAVGKQVIVLCCDLRRPSLHPMFGVEQGPGLSDALLGAGAVDVAHTVHATAVDRVRIVPPGWAEGVSPGLFGSEGMHRILAEAASSADIVLIDTVPVLAASDWTHLVPQVDAVLMVARVGATSWISAERSRGMLEMLQAPVVGVALNGLPASKVRRGGFRYQGKYGVSIDVDPASSPHAEEAPVVAIPEPEHRDGSNGSGNGDAPTAAADEIGPHLTRP